VSRREILAPRRGAVLLFGASTRPVFEQAIASGNFDHVGELASIPGATIIVVVGFD
jgi:hypothetical protein